MHKVLCFALKVVGGQESIVACEIERKLKLTGADVYVDRVFFPKKEHTIFNSRKPSKLDRALMTGYIFMEVFEMNAKIRESVNSVSGFLGFLTGAGHSKKDTPLPLREGDFNLIQSKEVLKEKCHENSFFEKGDFIKVTDGPFKNRVGRVDKVYPHKKIVSVSDLFIGSIMPVELDYSKVEKK